MEDIKHVYQETRRIVLFKGISKKDGSTIFGSYVYTTRKATIHSIIDENNEWHEIFRDSLMINNDWWEDDESKRWSDI